MPCLLLAGLEPLGPAPEEEPVPVEPPLPRRFGDYELLERLGEGGMGVVYKAFNVPLKRMEALKMSAVDLPANDDGVPGFLAVAEARAAASLNHPNIVHVIATGVAEGRPYFTMNLMEGGSLDQQMHRFRAPRAAARLMATVAGAVHHGHQRLILHRDLKPANLLLDAGDVPHVADFGLAQPLDTRKQRGPVGGTLPYMAPEQTTAHGPPLTVAADVYGLGSILYELLTGRPPFQDEGGSREALLARVREAEPLAPRALEPRIPRELEHIVLRCLHKEPTRRYGSAAELADDLQRFLKGEPVGPTTRARRVLAWYRGHPLEAGLLATLLWSLAVAAVAAFRIASAQEEDLRHDALRVNLYAARLVAGTVLFELAQYRQGVERAAARPELGAALQAGDGRALESFCRERFTYHDGPRGGAARSDVAWPFQRCFILDTTGRALAHWPPPPRFFIGNDYGWRNYFQAARRLADTGQRAAYVSRAFLGTSDGSNTFAISAPVYGPAGTWRGVLVATIASNSTLGSLRLDDPGGVNRTAMLVAPTDRPAPDEAIPSRDTYTVVVHERLGRGMPVALGAETARQLARALPPPTAHEEEQFLLPSVEGRVLEGYRDPVSSEPGTWLAAFAPVGNTGFAVIVQSREKAVLAVNAVLARRIAWWSLPFAVGGGLLWLLFWRLRQQALTEGKA
ncbi:protein kinase domain-containing protein [Pyxidicoccus xibeiensis]|uniref:protein kinase domain-containing protein n=1 Tax=Pyxidicoccus xibeiensis TaxID=2906759 RepID=UPI0020A70A04|nr:protein kinase [Pyxidicoccus xibeiensis]MCP3144680.1 protein kinase [Pyxidicoccus xibeiensis]